MSAERLLALVCFLLIAGCESRSANKEAKEAKKPIEQISDVYRGGAVEEAEKRLRAHLQAEPRDDLAWTLLGHALVDLNRTAEAEAAYAKALEIEPRRIEAITGQGRIFRMHKQYEQAMAAYKRATAIDPSFAQAWSSMMVVSLKRGLYDEAISHGEKAHALDKNDPTIAANLAIAYHYAGNTTKRDELTLAAQKLGFKSMDWLDKVYTGEIELRD
ncbi:tetratricopeptide repeat protein [Archangium violaceum]|uniref:tetratricopeptide repeat protein n=1 Tax=Archangium violaceum TaxID=83451 RepID=UPI0036D99F13